MTASGSRGLATVLSPRSIAVIGASRRQNTIGHQIVHNLLADGFTGVVHAVNTKGGAIAGLRAYPTIAEIPGGVDLAVIVVPYSHVQDVAEQVCATGTKAVVVISAGFAEVGEAGATRERALAALFQQHGVRMVGPNCMGVVNADPAVSMNATFARAMPPFGSAAFVSQSGALGLSILDHAREYGIGMCQFVSVGNKPDVSGNDLLELWEHDPAVKVILMYVESFGNPQHFLEIAARITKSKPIIVVKSGRSRAGARAASSHTGALAASDTAVEALLAQAGVIRANTVEELFAIAGAFNVHTLPASRRTAVLTNAGGPGILAADALDAARIPLPDLDPATVRTLTPLFPEEASIRNPLDMIASASAPAYTTALTALLADPNVDTAMPIFVPPFGIRQEDVAEAIAAAARTNERKPILAVLMGREGLPAGRADLLAAGIPTFVFPESAALALAALNQHVEWAARPPRSPTPLPVDRKRAAAILDGARTAGRERLDELEALDLLDAYGIPVAPARLVPLDPPAFDARLTAATDAVGYPLVMKVVSPAITHKTDAGGVRVGIGSAAEAAEAWAKMKATVGERAPGATITGVLVQRMVSGGRETIVGVIREHGFGPLLMFGLGGVFVEALGDVVFRLPPIDEPEARDMLRGIRGAKILDAIRGQPAADKAALTDVLRRIGQLAADFPEIAELDANPVLAQATGAVALDARVRIAPK
ncbi:MAG: acetate--CoA ligase family protein [Gemmatimonadaceae bacterium]|nr:acetate--CoA ligase family protein [Gemmatimonadaceae bacterium]